MMQKTVPYTDQDYQVELLPKKMNIRTNAHRLNKATLLFYYQVMILVIRMVLGSTGRDGTIY